VGRGLVFGVFLQKVARPDGNGLLVLFEEGSGIGFSRGFACVGSNSTAREEHAHAGCQKGRQEQPRRVSHANVLRQKFKPVFPRWTAPGFWLQLQVEHGRQTRSWFWPSNNLLQWPYVNTPRPEGSSKTAARRRNWCYSSASAPGGTLDL